MFIVVALFALPLAPFAWATLAGAARGHYWRSWLLRTGASCVALSALPLLLVGLAATLGLTRDPNPNPVGLGLLFVAGAIVGAVLALIGVVRTWWQLGQAGSLD
ncbi:MAG: hypothetical protein ACK5YB_12495 [Burkholderiales bacterium]